MPLPILANPPAGETHRCARPQPGTNNGYAQDGYTGGSYSNCSDPKQPGVDAIVGSLGKLPYHPNPNCAANTDYPLNSYNPGYNGDGSLLEKHISWKCYGEGWNTFKSPDPKFSGASVYCNICNPFLYEIAITAITGTTTATISMMCTTAPAGPKAAVRRS
ncbi:hypothetical protein [Burkholderia ubonensis]|uniref:hypothetical protein n=1 Tax=Burkholderia ubonensis TaxID=101571 RepID=UPI0026CC6E6C|nr:hypothetical protein [Burkholderia ubonensis]